MVSRFAWTMAWTLICVAGLGCRRDNDVVYRIVEVPQGCKEGDRLTFEEYGVDRIYLGCEITPRGDGTPRTAESAAQP